MIRAWGRRVLVAAVSAALVAGGAASGAATVATAAEPLVATVTAYGAPDGVFVQWTPQDGYNRSWRVTRTVDGSTSTFSWSGQRYSDTNLLPGQSATYTVAAVDGSGTGPESVPATGARDPEGSSAPAGARTLVLSGPEDPDGVPLPGRSQTLDPTLDWDGSVALGWGLGLAFGRLPGPGRYVLASEPQDGEIRFRTYCQSGPPRGVVDVHDVVYGASGVPLQLGADFAWSCGDGPVQRNHVRFNSATPLAEVPFEGPGTNPSVVRGGSVQTVWHLRNTGDAPATIGRLAARSGYSGIEPSTSSACDGVVLEPGASCDATVTVSTTNDVAPAPDGYPLQLSATVDGQPGVSADPRLKVYRELAAPTVRWLGRTTSAVALRIELPQAQEMQPLSGFLIERRVGSGAWSTVARPEGTSLDWTDWSAPSGAAVTYRVTTVAQNGEQSNPSSELSGVVPSEAVVSGNSGLRGGSDPDDPEWVSLRPPSDGIVTGMGASPDRQHLAVATYEDGANTARLYLTDLSGSNGRLLTSNNYAHEFKRLRFSPDGRRIAYVDGYGVGETVSIVDVATGALSAVRSQGVPYGWSPDGTALLMAGGETPINEHPAGLRWVKVAGESWTSVTGTSAVPDDNFTVSTSVTVSRTGEIAWVGPASTGGKALYRVPAAGGTASVLWAPAGCSLNEPRFSPTGTEVAVGVGGASCVAGKGTIAVRVPASGAATSWRRLLSWSGQDPAWTTTSRSVPTTTVSVPAVTSASAQVRLGGVDADDAVGGLTFSCRLDAGAWKACGPTWALSDLAAGSHTVTAVATDPSGQRSAPVSATWTVDRAAPSVSLTALPTALLGSSLSLAWSAKDSGGSVVESYDVRERYASPSGGYTAYVYPSTWQKRTSSSLALKLSAGYSYCFSVRARDKVGNLGAFTPERCTSVALDDRALSNHGGTRSTNSRYLSGTYTRLTGTPQYLSRTSVKGRRLGLVVATCSTCAPLDVWVGGVKWGRVSTYSSTTRYRQVVWLPLSSSTRSGTVVVRPASSRSAYVDGLVILK
ncbi:hypothetical protein SAMN05216199_0906 [Pedococcus cremeus]|uniref:Fibronectin type-III domain-containing protein n=1 Tax=Pedococcus cremeus TaxID=587636 RepID=A0A1H9RBL3_9MICO|nr:hypothetical protein [Pedococcus cremeus]SER69439.1 hypothetical protein SAMN05216199_0906 [Pedococcus cremeus]